MESDFQSWKSNDLPFEKISALSIPIHLRREDAFHTKSTSEKEIEEIQKEILYTKHMSGF